MNADNPTVGPSMLKQNALAEYAAGAIDRAELWNRIASARPKHQPSTLKGRLALLAVTILAAVLMPPSAQRRS